MKEVILSKEEKKLYDEWSKEEIYIAYLFSDSQSKLCHKEVLRLNRMVAGLEHDIRVLQRIVDEDKL